MAKGKTAEPVRAQAHTAAQTEVFAVQRPPLALALLFATMIFSSGFLLLVLVPMFARMLLPRFGDSPAVWSTTLVLLFLVALAGVAYAQLLRALPARTQAIVHGVVALLPFLLMPVAAPAWLSDPTATPILGLFAIALPAIGLPLFALAATVWLGSSWFARLWPDADAYALYGISSLGSVVALILYSIALEPFMPLSLQSRLWYAGYVIFVLQLAGCALLLLRGTRTPAGQRARPQANGAEAIGALRILRWVLLGAVPASLMFGIASFVRDEVLGIPVIWTAPAAVYFATLAVAFGLRRFIPRIWVMLAAALALVIVAAVMAMGANHIADPISPAFHLIAFFFVALYCHMALRDDAPEQGSRTEFYFWFALGAAAGALFSALVAPQSFYIIFEYPVALVVAALLLPNESNDASPTTRLWDVALPICLALGFAVYLIFRSIFPSPPFNEAMQFALASFVTIAAWRRSLRFGLALAVMLIAATTIGGLRNSDYYRARNLYGIKHVAQVFGFNTYLYGTVLRGAESTNSAYEREPLASYSPVGPAGPLLAALQPNLKGGNVGVVGLGIGSLACYAQPGQSWTFYESDPQVVQIASNSALFHFLSACYPNAEIVTGNARFALAHGQAGRFALLIVDPNASGSMATSLMTREAFATYRGALGPHGVLAVTIATPTYDVRPVLANLAGESGWTAYARDDTQNAQNLQGWVPSTWIVMARDAQDLGGLTRERGWAPLTRNDNAQVWTDDLNGSLKGQGA